MNVDLEYERAALREVALDLGLEGAVAVPMHVCPLDELSRSDAYGELVFGEVVIGRAIDLTRAGRARSSGDRQTQIGSLCAHTRDERSLSNA